MEPVISVSEGKLRVGNAGGGPDPADSSRCLLYSDGRWVSYPRPTKPPFRSHLLRLIRKAVSEGVWNRVAHLVFSPGHVSIFWIEGVFGEEVAGRVSVTDGSVVLPGITVECDGEVRTFDILVRECTVPACIDASGRTLTVGTG